MTKFVGVLDNVLITKVPKNALFRPQTYLVMTKLAIFEIITLNFIRE